MKIVKKPWGYEKWFAFTKNYVGKILFIKKGRRLSKQYHKVKHETIYTLSGKYIMELRNTKKLMKQSSVIVIPPKKIHRMYAKFCDVTLVEVSTPEVWDVVRMEDDYGRTRITADKRRSR
ncbi:MAG: cupin [Elusimicrobia bacterium]|nr:cupin [Elusimicrobiota bacterium]